jgi:5'-methylthioadenosine phosphorylase
MARLMENAVNAQALVGAVVEQLHLRQPASAAHTALSSALITPIAAMSPAQRERLAPLIKRMV